MTLLVTLGASSEAFGHPTSCTEPAPGSVGSSGSGATSVTVNDASGAEQPLATTANASLQFSSHAHSYEDTNDDGEKECTNNASHDFDPSTVSSSISINGSPVYIAGSGVGTDPVSGGDVDITDAGVNQSLTETP